METAGLTYVFPDGNGIKNITFQVKRGEIYALYGGHHAGKSVLLQAIIGAIRPQSGTFKLFGNIDDQQERRRIGFVPQKQNRDQMVTFSFIHTGKRVVPNYKVWISQKSNRQIH